MNAKIITYPFNINIARRIVNQSVLGGEIKTVCGKSVKILTFDRIYENPIVALVRNGIYDECVEYDLNGESKIYPHFKLVFSINKEPLLKDGVFYQIKENSLGIYNPNYNTYNDFLVPFYVGLSRGEVVFHEDSEKSGFGLYDEIQITYEKCGFNLSVNENLKIKFKEKLSQSNHPKAKEYLKRFFNYEEKTYNFKTFDKVLVRNHLYEMWKPAFMYYKDKDSEFPYITMDGNKWKYCIPFDGNEHLMITHQ